MAPDAEPTRAAVPGDAFEVRVIRSTNRRKTSQARLRGGVLEVRVPATLNEAQAAEVVAGLVDRVQRQQTSFRVDLPDRARVLARRFRLPEPGHICWVSNQAHRWGSCTPADRSIRISDRLAKVPGWVLDYVIVHELAHLAEPGHGEAFHALVGRYPDHHRAAGFLEGYACGLGTDA